MASNASRGAAAKGRTKKWLQAQGYQVADLEVVRWIFTPRGRVPVKRDQFASDLLAVNEHFVCFVQVKSGASAAGGTFPAARRAFLEFTFPANTRRLIVGWPPRARVPRVIEVDSDGRGHEYGQEKGRDKKQGEIRWDVQANQAVTEIGRFDSLSQAKRALATFYGPAGDGRGQERQAR